MRLSYYPGCSLEGTALDYDQSVRQVFDLLDIELVEIDDWNCCGASSAHMTDHEVGMRLPMRNLLIASDMGNDLLVPCAACFQRLKAADKELRRDCRNWDVPLYGPEFDIIHISPFLARPEVLEILQEKCSGLLKGLNIACYYGCLSLRNPKITGVGNWETPRSLELVMAATGATPVSWSHRTECCSGSLTMARPDIAEKLVGDIVAAARRGGAEAIVTDCPMCQANVESRQITGERDGLTVFYATELILAALTGSYPIKQQKGHLIEPAPLVRCMAENQSAREGSV